MNRHFIRVAAAALMAITLSGQAVRAQDNNFWAWLHPWGAQDWRLTFTSIGLGAGATAGYFALRKKHGYFQTRTATPLGAFALTTVGCMSVFPIVGTLWLNRPLTHREVYTGMADCVVPFVGSWLMEYAYHGQAWYEK
jgi:hypothetical protein